MEQNIKMVISYDGSRYLGWQRLGGEQRKQSIQGTLEMALEELFGQSVSIIGSGRTDAGVHAMGQVANFLIEERVLFQALERNASKKKPKDMVCFLRELKQLLNERLPEDIRILSMVPVKKTFHSRYSAVEKTYEYHIDTREVPNVFTRKNALWEPENLELDKMEEAAKILIGKHDFKAFSTQGKVEKDTIRTLKQIQFTKENNHLKCSFTGDGFLYNMVRILMGTLLEIGRGEREMETIVRAFATGDRQLAGATVSSVGLFLKEVRYKE